MTDFNQSKDKLEDILNTPEYQIYYVDNRSIFEKWWDSVVEWFNELMMKIFSSFSPSSGFATVLVIIIGVIVLALIVLAVYFLVRHYRRKYRFQEQAPFSHKQEKDWTYNQHLVYANEQEEAGNMKLATRHLFLALLLYFHEKGFVEAKLWKTNWEYFDELKRVEKKRAESFDQLARIFDDVVYGERKIEGESFLKYKEKVLYWIQVE